MKTRSNKTLAKKGGKCGCGLSGGSYYKYNDLRNATPRDFLLSERDGAVGALKGGRRRRTRRRTRCRTRRRTRTRCAPVVQPACAPQRFNLAHADCRNRFCHY